MSSSSADGSIFAAVSIRQQGCVRCVGVAGAVVARSESALGTESGLP